MGGELCFGGHNTGTSHQVLKTLLKTNEAEFPWNNYYKQTDASSGTTDARGIPVAKIAEILPEPIGFRAPTSTRTTEPTDAPPNPAPTLSSTGVSREPTVPGGAATSSPLPTTSESMATQLPTSTKKY